jgi:hypothetical protein
MKEFKHEIITSYDQDHIIQEIKFNNNIIQSNILTLHDEGIRKALIDLGWTPPKKAIEEAENNNDPDYEVIEPKE